MIIVEYYINLFLVNTNWIPGILKVIHVEEIHCVHLSSGHKILVDISLPSLWFTNSLTDKSSGYCGSVMMVETLKYPLCTVWKSLPELIWEFIDCRMASADTLISPLFHLKGGCCLPFLHLETCPNMPQALWLDYTLLMFKCQCLGASRKSWFQGKST